MTRSIPKENSENYLPQEVRNILNVLDQIEEHTANIGKKLLSELKAETA